MKRQKRTLGSVVKIDLGNGYHSYARILDKGNVAVYDIRTNKDFDIDRIINYPVLFIVAVYKDVITQGTWEQKGTRPLEEKLSVLPMQFIQDSIDENDFSLYNPNTGKITPSTKKECLGLESAAVWEAEHVVDRINDYYAGRKNKWVEQLEIK